jgi:hypothetical protein
MIEPTLEDVKNWGTKIGGGIVFMILGWILAIQPVKEEIQLKNNKLKTMTARSEAIQEIHSIQKQIDSMGGKLFVGKDRNMLLSQISALANESGMEVASIVPSEDRKDVIPMLIFTLHLNTPFISFVRLLEKLEAMTPPLVVGNFSMERSGFGGEDNRTSEATLVVQGLMKS